MGRLTKRDTDGRAMMDCQKCEADWTGKHGKPMAMADCTALYCRSRLLDRLVEYEDTGLEPEEVLPKDKADEIALKLMRLADLESICSYTRLRELAEADKDGRVVVLPCKVGDTVWITGSVRRLYSEKVRTFFCGNPSYGRGMSYNSVQMIRTTGCDIPIHEFGKTVFLTREEAEKALEAMKDE